jgi:hypothetical protein
VEIAVKIAVEIDVEIAVEITMERGMLPGREGRGKARREEPVIGDSGLPGWARACR